MKNSRYPNRRGLSLLELMVTTAMMATLVGACMNLMRTSYTAWNRHEEDHAKRQVGLAVLKHITRQTRQMRSVLAISGPSDNSGSLTLLSTDGRVWVWDHDSSTNQVLYGENTATSVLATDVAELNFVGLKLDGSTATTEAGLIHAIDCTTKVNLTRPSGTQAVEASCRAWIRAW